MLRVGAWTVDPASGEIARDGESSRLEVRALRLLLYLAERAGEVVSIEELLDHVWPGVAVSPDSVYQAVTSLRRQLGDDPRQPSYIATVPRLGYRMVASVSSFAKSATDQLPESGTQNPAPSPSDVPEDERVLRKERNLGRRIGWAAGVMVCAVTLVLIVLNGRAGDHQRSASTADVARPEKSLAVLPFLDLTKGMTEEEFADGVTEELIDKLSKVPGLSVPAPTASFYYKGKQMPVAEIARSLGVAYVLDGSVRKSGGRVRIAARLVRADNGYVMWTESYDRPFTDTLMVQDDIAGKVTKALQAAIGG